MNAVLASPSPTPTALQPDRRSHPARRRLISGYALSPSTLGRFNQLLARVGHPATSDDELATLARRVARPDRPDRAGGVPAWIAKRLRRGVTINLMVADPSWEIDHERAEAAVIVATYLREPHDLIPDDLPGVGRLDDAFLVDAAWPRLSVEVRDYLDFCHVRHVEAELRGCNDHDFSFGRADWIAASGAEKAWIAHCRRVGRSSYLPTRAAALFRVC